MSDWGLSDAGLTTLLADAVTVGGFLSTSLGLTILTGQVTKALTEFHARQPAMPGITANTLRLAPPVRLPRDSFDALLTHLLETGTVAAEGHLFKAMDHRGGLTGADARLWAKLRPLLEAAPFRPPLLREAAASLGAGDVALRRACKGFARSGLVVEVAPDRFFVISAVPEMAEAAHALSTETVDGWFTAAQYRDRIGCGRQLAIQVLDYFDRRGVTVRRGDLRRAGKGSATLLR